ncbi:MAG: DUF2934 domain-containing protein, partial [Planctomycetia bacterium]|nr:DUF2934 domain-containing protein [Planctomycetia bacterium]
RAYELWQAQGCPAGRDIDLWLQAEREIVRINAGAGDRLDCFVSSYLDFLAALNETVEALSETKLRGARLTDSLIQRGLKVTRRALQRITRSRLSLELFGFGDDDWVPVTSDGKTMAAKVLYHEDVLMGDNLVGSVDELVNRGSLPASVTEVLRDEGIRAIAVWRVNAVDIPNQRKVRPALVLYALASESNAFTDDLTRYILDQGAAQLGLAIAVGQRDELLLRSSKLADDLAP